MSKPAVTKTGKETASDSFSDFFHYASKEEKMKVFEEAARKACADQRKVFRKAKMTIRSTSK